MLTALLLLGALLSGCGENDGDQTPEAEPTAASTAAVPTPTLAPTPPNKPRPTRAPTQIPEGDGDSEDDDRPPAVGGGICADLAPTDVGAVLGGDASGSALPGSGCAFNRTDPRSPAATFVEIEFSTSPGGMDGARTTATSSVEGDPVDIAGIGDAAFVVTGTAFGGSELQGAGAVRIGDRLIQVTLTQSEGLGRAKVKALVLNLLRLAVAQA